jgi:hypothetical protein
MINRAILGSTCGTLAACLIVMTGARAQQKPAAAVADASSGVELNVGGIAPGMTVKQSMLALKADNPKMSLEPTTLRLEGFKDDVMLLVKGREAATAQSTGEDVSIAFTVIPGKEVVWGVRRVLYFANAERPPLQGTLDALHKKYGPETFPPDPDPRQGTKQIVWVYDAQGRPMGPQGKQAQITCGRLATNIESVISIQNDLDSGGSWVAACGSVTIVSATVQASMDAASRVYVVNNLTWTMADGARYRANLEATRAVMLEAGNASAKKAADDVNKRTIRKF